MKRRCIFLVLCLAVAAPPAAFSQDIREEAGHVIEPRSLSKTEGRRILASLPTVEADSNSETDCSHFVHDVYEQAGFPYDYVSSREIYIGNINFTRVQKPQAGDLVVWRGHVGIVIDPKEHSFFSSVRNGPDTQFYDSPYWRSRGVARFYRYVIDRAGRGARTLAAAREAQEQAPAGQVPVNRPPRDNLEKPKASVSSALASGRSGTEAFEAPREIVLQVAGKNPTEGELAAGFIEMNQASAKSLRAPVLNSLSKQIIIYRGIRVSAVQIKGKRGTALASIESLGSVPDSQLGSEPSWKEESLEFVKTKRGWLMSPGPGAAYVSRELALQILSARLAELARNTNTTPLEEREQEQIIRLLNALIPETSRAEASPSN